MNTKNLKPFDLKAALQGEPVMLRNGQKAFVRYHETEAFILGNFSLIGIKEAHPPYPHYLTWSPEGAYEEHRHDYDITNMWPKTHIINGFEVPAPETEEPNDGDRFFVVCLGCVNLYAKDKWSGGQLRDAAAKPRPSLFNQRSRNC